MLVFQHYVISDILFHAKNYKQVIATNDYTAKFQDLDNMHYISIHVYVKIEENARKHYVITKSTLVIRPAITLPLSRYWRKIMSSYQHTE